MELVDIVSKDNRVISKTTKQKAHKKGLLHRTILAHVRDSKGRWLLVKQSSNRQDAGQYVSPVGGHIKAGETHAEALKRETFEELGFKNFKNKFVKKFIFNRFVLNRQENHYMMFYEVYTDELPILNYESESYKYFTEEELKEDLRENPKLFGSSFHHLVGIAYRYLIK